VTYSAIPQIGLKVDFAYISGEPARRSFGKEEERTAAMESRVRRVLEFGVSLIAVDPSNNFKLVGLRTAKTVLRLGWVKCPFSAVCPFTTVSPLKTAHMSI
jgi:hypothetical protein